MHPTKGLLHRISFWIGKFLGEEKRKISASLPVWYAITVLWPLSMALLIRPKKATWRVSLGLRLYFRENWTLCLDFFGETATWNKNCEGIFWRIIIDSMSSCWKVKRRWWTTQGKVSHFATGMLNYLSTLGWFYDVFSKKCIHLSCDDDCSSGLLFIDEVESNLPEQKIK